jgi:hypothetical protein
MRRRPHSTLGLWVYDQLGTSYSSQLLGSRLVPEMFRLKIRLSRGAHRTTTKGGNLIWRTMRGTKRSLEQV